VSPSERRRDRSHGEDYPGGPAPGQRSEEDRYGAKQEPPKPDRAKRGEPKPAAPPPHHERNS
jgi:hypothetical protein